MYKKGLTGNILTKACHDDPFGLRTARGITEDVLSINVSKLKSLEVVKHVRDEYKEF